MAHGMDTASHALGADHDKPKKEVREIRTRKAANGGHIHEHHHVHPEHHPMEEHTTSGDDAMAEHMMENMGSQNPGEADADAGTADPGAAPAAGAPPAPIPGA